MKDYRDWFYDRYSTAIAYRAVTQKIQQEQFQQYKSRWSRWLPKSLQSSILDVGCGNGEFLLFLQSLSYENLEGIDLDYEQVERARSAGLKRVERTTAQDYLANKCAKYDLISAFNLFEHLTKSETIDVLEAMHRALKPDGRILVITPNGTSPFAGSTRYWDFSHEQSFTPASWRQLARVIGFEQPVFEEFGPEAHSWIGGGRVILWNAIKLVLDFYSYVEVARSRDQSRVYTADMKVILQKVLSQSYSRRTA